MINSKSCTTCVSLILASALLSSSLYLLPVQADNQPAPLPTGRQNLSTIRSLSPVLKTVMPGVVNIHTQMAIPKWQTMPQTPGGEAPDPSKMNGVGAGVVFSPETGHILTNLHVVKEADVISVTLHDGRNFPANLIGIDPETDLAMLQINAKNLSTIPFANSDKVEVGDFVIAIGSPFGLNQTVTSGIVSALGRNIGIEGYEDFIQTDAPINPGNSGGALLNMAGELIGINTAILSAEGSQANVGIGFAIPANMAKNIGEQLIQFGKVRRGLLGVFAQPLTPDLAEAFGVSVTKGALIDQVAPRSLAEQNGVKAGDIVLSVNNRTVSNASDLRNGIGLVQIGAPVVLQIIRDNRPITVRFVMQDPQQIPSEAELIFPQLAGAQLINGEENRTLHGKVPGVRLLDVQPGSPAWEAGLRPDDLIMAANHTLTPTLSALQTAARMRKHHLLLRVVRERNVFFMVLKSAD